MRCKVGVDGSRQTENFIRTRMSTIDILLPQQKTELQYKIFIESTATGDK